MAQTTELSTRLADNKDLYKALLEKKDIIEAKFGEELEWYSSDTNKSSSISTSFPGLDFSKQDNCPELMNKAINIVVKFREIIKEYI